jgi:multiple sugar transport system permease protein
LQRRSTGKPSSDDLVSIAGAPAERAAKAPVSRRARRRRRHLRHYGVVTLFLSPWLIGLVTFTLYPTFASLYFSFTHYDLLTAPKWVGFSNYRFMFSDPNFWQSLRNTMWMVVFATPIQVAFAIGCAMVLIRVRQGTGIYRTIFFVPTMVPAVAATLGFVFMLNPSGPIDRVLSFLHIPQPLWFEQPAWSKPGLLMLGLWGVGNTMIIFLAALLDVPKELYEAADIEGASPWQRFRNVTLPMISPVIFFSLVTGVIYGFQYFTEGYVASVSGGLGSPQGSLLFYSIWLYQEGFQYFHMGYASAMAWVLFIIIMATTLVLVRSSRRWVHYQGGFL